MRSVTMAVLPPSGKEIKKCTLLHLFDYENFYPHFNPINLID
jgi:hypothetical protein